MRKSLLNAVAVLGLVLMAAMSAQAQDDSAVSVKVPFDFSAGGSDLAAGEYAFKFVSRNQLLVRRADNGKSILLMVPMTAEAGNERGVERMVFRRYGDRYFLAQVWTRRNTDGRMLPPSSAERRLLKEIRAAGQAPRAESVTVAAGK